MIISSNLKKRIIPIILVDKYQVVTSKLFGDYRVVGNLEQTIEVFNIRNVDEIIVLDITSSKIGNRVDENILKLMSKNTMMPFSYGGAIKSLHDIEYCLKNGCDKIVLNHSIIHNQNLLKNSIKEFGKQAIVTSINYKFLNGNEYIFDHVKNSITNITLSEYLKIIENIGCAEIMLTNIQRDGQLNNYDYKIIKKFRSKITRPLIINGGCSSPKNMLIALQEGADACGAGSMFFYKQHSYRNIKEYLKNKNISVR